MISQAKRCYGTVLQHMNSSSGGKILKSNAAKAHHACFLICFDQMPSSVRWKSIACKSKSIPPGRAVCGLYLHLMYISEHLSTQYSSVFFPANMK